jgi:hypothetical protein
MVALDDAFFLKGPYAPQAGRSGKSDTARQIHIGHPAFSLKFGKQVTIDAIKRCH